VRVQSASRFVAVSGNTGGVCGLTDGQSVECWGSVPTAAGSSPVPVPIAPGLRVAAVESRCLLTTSGEVHCWGSWVVPIYEDGTRDSRTPKRVTSPVAFRQLSVGSSHLCGVTADGAAYCWGSNFSGQLGIAGSTQAPGCFTACEPSPQLVPELPPTRQVQVNEFASTCALDLQGAVRCWGEAYANGRTAAASTPVQIADAPPFVTLSGGSGTACGLTAGGEAWCWGSLFYRPDGAQQLSSPRAIRAAPAFPLRTLSVQTASTTCGISTEAQLHCWGQGMLGDGVYEPNTFAWRVGRVAGQR
jgi:alpha-tubulin suppressor-like RCC1 family protein